MYPYDFGNSGFGNFNPYQMNNFGQNMNGYGQQFQQMQQSQAQQMQAPGGMDIVTVQNVQQVEQIQLSPGQRRLVMVQNEPVVAMRSADNMGIATTEYYQLVKFNPSDTRQKTAENDYITKEQLESRLSEMFEQLATMKKENE